MKVLNFYHIGKIIPDNAIYIGRGNSKFNLQESKFANPFPITKDCGRQEVIDKYKVWLWNQIKQGLITKEDILSLDGKDLVCYCSPCSCHGDVLLKAIEYFKLNMIKIPFTKFNETKNLIVNIYYQNKRIDSTVWDQELYIERDEDWYALMSPQLKDIKVRVITKKEWDYCYETVNEKITWSRKEGYQINSKSDKRFSAFNSIMSDGKSIEEHYQCGIKGYTSIKEGKGKPPLDTSKDLFTEYLNLWRKWSIDKDDLLLDLFNKVKEHNYILGDFFATTPVNQAHALSVILNEKYLGFKRVLIAGSRDFNNYNLVKEVIDSLQKDIKIGTIISGTARGADSLGEQYANENNISLERYPANWDLHGKSAGYIRNKQMAEVADVLVAFWNGSNGTKNMIDLAKAKNIKVIIIRV